MSFAAYIPSGPVIEHFYYGPLMAPEIEAGEPHDYRADIWSLGQLAIQLLSAMTIPTDYAIPTSTGFFVCRPWKEDVPDEVKDLCFAMISPEPSERPEIWEILEHPWFKKKS